MGGFGAPDRGGSREGKKSLRGNKQAIQKLIKDEQKGHVRTGPRPTVSDQPPPATPPNVEGPALVDAAAQLASRQFDRDQFKVLQRAASTGVGPIIAYTTDDSKLEALVRAAKENAGQVYCMIGVHSDNIKRANDRLSPARLEQLKDLVLEASCVAVLAGLAFRDVGIRYAQERALTEQMELAAGVGLPLVLYEVRAAEALVERITEFRLSGAGDGRAASTPIAIFNFAGSEEELAAYLALGCYVVLTGRVCDPGERGDRLRELAASIPADRLMLASDSPFTTPQNIPDVFVREGRNEPSNLPFVLEALAPALGMSTATLAAATRKNTLAFFGIREAAEAEAEAEAVAATAGATAGPATAGVGPEGAESGKAVGGKGGKTSGGQRRAKEADEAGTPADRRGQAPGGAQEHGQGAEEERGDAEETGDESGEQEEENDEREGGTDDARTGGGAAAGGSKREAGRAANLFALMNLQDEDGDGGDGQDGGDDEGEDEEDRPGGAAERLAGAAGASTSAAEGYDDGAASARRGTRDSGAKPPPRNFVAEHAAAAAAKGPATGPRVSYSCRGCRSVLFTEADTELHQDEERALFAAAKPRKKGRGRQSCDTESGMCSMHFMRRPLAWMETCLQSEGPRRGEGKLVCPTCAAKLGKWAAGAGAEGVPCSCGVVVPAPAYALLKARLDILDSQLDIAAAVQSTLKAYEEEEEAGSASSGSGDEGPSGRKKRQKQKRNKTANFSSFRNKTFGFRLKEQRQLAETVTTTGETGGGRGAGAMGAVDEGGSD